MPCPTVWRCSMASSWEKINVDGSNMRAYVSAPDHAQRVPAIVVVQGQTGVDDFVEFSDMVARQGFIAAAPDLYHRDPLECKDDAPTRRMRLRDATVIVDIKIRRRCDESLPRNHV